MIDKTHCAMVEALVDWDREVTGRELARNCGCGPGSPVTDFETHVREREGLDPWSLLDDPAFRSAGVTDTPSLLYRTIVSNDARMLAHRIDDRMRQLRAEPHGDRSMDDLLFGLYSVESTEQAGAIYSELARLCRARYTELCAAAADRRQALEEHAMQRLGCNADEMFAWCRPSIETARTILTESVGELPLHFELLEIDRLFVQNLEQVDRGPEEALFAGARKLAESFPWVPGKLEVHRGRHPQAFCRPDTEQFDLWSGDFTRVAGCILPTRSRTMSQSQRAYHTAHEAMHTVAYTSPVDEPEVLLRNLYDAERLESFADLGAELGRTPAGAFSLARCLTDDDHHAAESLSEPLRLAFGAHGKRMSFWRATYRIVEDALMSGLPDAEIEQTFLSCMSAGNEYYAQVPGFEKTWPIVGLFRVPYGTHPHLVARRELDKLCRRLEHAGADWGDLDRPGLARFVESRGREAIWDEPERRETNPPFVR